MNAAKETINYYCDDIIKDGYLGQGITAAVLDTGISLHPDFDSRIVAFRDFVDHREEVYDDSGLMWQGSWAAVGKCQMAGMQEWRQM